MKRRIKNAAKFLLTGTCQIDQKRHKANEFVEWLGFANAGMLDPGNIYCIEYAIEHLPSDSPVVEIGSFCGLSTNMISFYLRKSGKANLLITADKWTFEGAEVSADLLEGTAITHGLYKAFVKESYIRNISFFSKDHLPYTVEAFSDDFFERWSADKKERDVLGRSIQLGGKISFAYIDGNHTYDFAKRDFEHVDEHLEKGGFILFDDSSKDSQFDVYKVVLEILKGKRYEVVVNNPNYMLRKIR